VTNAVFVCIATSKATKKNFRRKKISAANAFSLLYSPFSLWLRSKPASQFQFHFSFTLLPALFISLSPVFGYLTCIRSFENSNPLNADHGKRSFIIKGVTFMPQEGLNFIKHFFSNGFDSGSNLFFPSIAKTINFRLQRVSGQVSGGNVHPLL
jgi:hypothetical protein